MRARPRNAASLSPSGHRTSAAVGQATVIVTFTLLDLVGRQLQVEIGLERRALAGGAPALVLHRASCLAGVPDGERASAVHPLEIAGVAGGARRRPPGLLDDHLDRPELPGGGLDGFLADDFSLRRANERAAAAGLVALDVADVGADGQLVEERQIRREDRYALHDEIAALRVPPRRGKAALERDLLDDQ